MTGQTDARSWVLEVERIDRAVYAAIAGTPTPLLDGAMRRISRAADYSRLSLAASALMATTGGPGGRRAAASGLAALGATSAFVNVVLKPVSRRRRPNRTQEGVPLARQIKMPTSASFPSGHTAAAVAFASGAGRVSPLMSVPLHALSALVGYSRVHTGVHYPGDVVAGAVLGAVITDLSAGLISRISRTSRS